MRPKWNDLTKDQKQFFNNGIGPSYFPSWLRNFITKTCSFFFDEAAWGKHDFGYYIGKSVFEKFEYDFKFFRAMIRDSIKQHYVFIPLATTISIFFYLSVTLFGWFSFHFSPTYQNIKE